MNISSTSYKWWVLVSISIANFSSSLDMSIVTISFPRLSEVFNTSASTVVWLTIAFSIAELGLILTLARIGDTIGRKRVYLIGLVVYTIGLIFCSVSPNITMLILSRAVQGAGAAMALTVGSAIVIAVFPREEQGRALGIFSMLMSVGLIAGPALGGFLIDYLDWQGLFYTRIPVGILSLVMAIAVVKEQKQPGVQLHLDIPGAVTLLLGTSSLVLFLNLGSGWGYLSVPALALVIAAVVFLGIFFFVERKAIQPVLDLKLFRSRVFSMASGTTLFHMMGASMAPVLFPFFLIGGILMSASTVGMLMAIIAIPPVILSPISGWISDKLGFRLPMITACICFSLALYLSSRLGFDAGIGSISLVLLLFGVGMGVLMPPTQSAIVGSAPRHELASAMGVANTMRLLGASVGTAMGGSLYAYQLDKNMAATTVAAGASGTVKQIAVVNSFQFVMLIAAMIASISIITSVLTVQTKKATHQ
ncbi:MAG: DHA2 family efflux MFS transporter permease subunit [Dehalococcoidales bacterium]|nr:DHA2 family efflux MFS transporter permease subunit [Dehalococcoidales bacterium]